MSWDCSLGSSFLSTTGLQGLLKQAPVGQQVLGNSQAGRELSWAFLVQGLASSPSQFEISRVNIGVS